MSDRDPQATAPEGGLPGATIVRASRIGTVAFVATAAAAAATDDARSPLRTIAAVTAGVLFTVGVGVFFWAYAVAVARSRTDAIGIGGLFFLAGDQAGDPALDDRERRGRRRHRRGLLAALAIQTAAALATAAARPFTSLAFGVLAPLFGLALTGLYGARHGRFAPSGASRRAQ